MNSLIFKYINLLLLLNILCGDSSGQIPQFEIDWKVEQNAHKIKIEGEDKILLNIDPASDEKRAIFVAKIQFKPALNEQEWLEITSGRDRKYTWMPEECFTFKTPRQPYTFSRGFFTPKDSHWGTEFGLTILGAAPLNGKKLTVARGEIKIPVIAPLIELESASFGESVNRLSGNGFVVLQKHNGAQVTLPEVLRPENGRLEEKSVFGYYAGEEPSYALKFRVKPSSIKSLAICCTNGILKSNEINVVTNESGIAEGIFNAKDKLKNTYHHEPIHAEWEFNIFDQKLFKTEKFTFNNCYILLEKKEGFRPWSNLLIASFKQCNLHGVESQDSCVDNLSAGISALEYLPTWNAATGNKGSTYVNQEISPMPFSVMQLIDHIALWQAGVEGAKKPAIICTEAAGLHQFLSLHIANKSVTANGICWDEVSSETNTSYENGHAYTIYSNIVHDPVPKAGGNTNKTEEAYLKDYKKDKQDNKGATNFTEPKIIEFQFN